ncbi:DUF4159 domain-containing protein [Pararhizobium haloflavum]|uniref:DUF4159 domain-containing protein n=1 Tax=Pararhizobium haloflavum TaxID=2037914 RepID=UPI000C1A6104
MLGLPLAFAAPAVLFGLIALPIIWWLLRLTPPRPREEIFPPLRILARITRREETPSKSPWWLTALRLALAGLVILALADPVFNPRENAIATDGPLALVVDNGWASAPDWDARTARAEQLIADAESHSVPVSLVFTADRDHNAAPASAAEARDRLNAARPQPLHTDRARAMAAVVDATRDDTPATLALLGDGIADRDGEEETADLIRALGVDTVQLYEGQADTLALTEAENSGDAFLIEATRLDAGAARSVPVAAHDVRGRSIAEGTIEFPAGETAGRGRIAAPFELRNDFARLSVEGVGTAGTTFLLDDSFRRRRVGLLSGAPTDMAQPLLSPLYYIERALEPYADLVRPENAELSAAIPELLESRPSVLVMADIGTLPEDAYGPVTQWIENGGTLLRFAGPRLAGAEADDPLVPVELRQGERALGGALSWTEPQALAPYAAESPFAGMPPPQDIIVNRQVLAEPSADLARNTWASLEDGTPLVTTRAVGGGRIVLFHVTAEATWSNLPISGDFVEMLRRTVMLSAASGMSAEAGGGEPQALPPYRLLGADGLLTDPSGDARPLQIGTDDAQDVSFEHPPGLYGTEDGFTALNLMRADDRLEPFALPDTMDIVRSGYVDEEALPLKPHLFTLALILLLVDTVIVMVMSGAFRGLSRHFSKSATVNLFAGLLVLAAAFAPTGASAQESDTHEGDADILAQLDTTHIGYVVTGEEDVDAISERGLVGLSRFLAYRTALEPGAPAGLDIETDQLAFYPLIYWPISATAPMPSDAAISRIDAYMKAGGTVLFDTRDQFSGLGDQTSPETERLRAILANLDIPPLEPVPEEHVLTKAFYLLPEFPGRYRGGEMWIEQLPDDETDADRAMASADGVSSVIITGNDLAGAWAVDDNEVPMFPTVPADPAQREYAYRTGVNIMMYMLTGNYKTDQVHVPALLERLGQ